ncbi:MULTISPECIES: ATP-binding protein [unclassified Pasteurella]|uniref:BbrUII/HgiDII family restriction enzyme n=1 Tax=unclassified Pasteurella TaxID=2621516 RepID=UPI0010730347|nr:ATP-binding protein [Pasteurella sp. 19428wF3_WM03]TFU50661.1 ATP-binding protein [Pasteurella sp. WM03]
MAKFKIDLNVLNHLGLSLYTNTPAVLTEIVSNAWDADATEVHIDIDKDNGTITISDDGHGMNTDDVENKFLNVGYARRKDNRAKSPKFQRDVMGRKGIGKLAMFSLANEVSVYTKTEEDDNVVALKVDVSNLSQAIEQNQDYETESIDDVSIFTQKHGTTIILSELDKQIKTTATYLKKHLARRFSIIGQKFNFKVFINKEEITLEDRGYTSKIEFLWSFDNSTLDLKNKASQYKELPNKVNYNGRTFEITGFIASVGKPSELKDEEVSNNAITILANGRIFQENILEELDNAKIFTSYLVGEVNANFLDDSDYQDMATSSRQGLRQNDERYSILKNFIADALKIVDTDWDTWRKKEGLKEVKAKHPSLQKWLDSLSDTRDKKAAEDLLSKVNTIRFNGSDEEQEASRKDVLKSAVLAFEKLKVRGNLERLNELSSFDARVFKPILQSIDDIEESYFYDVTKQRLGIIEKFKNLVDENQKEKVVQEYLYNHLWLLDPSWERTTESYIEQPLTDEIKRICPEIECGARVDIAYKAITGKHVIIEMKRPLVKTDIFGLAQQGAKYRSATQEWYRNNQGLDEISSIEIYFLIGSQSKDRIYKTAEKNVIDGQLQSINAKILTYDELITKANQAYNTYLTSRSEVRRIKELIDAI